MSLYLKDQLIAVTSFYGKYILLMICGGSGHCHKVGPTGLVFKNMATNYIVLGLFCAIFCARQRKTQVAMHV